MSPSIAATLHQSISSANYESFFWSLHAAPLELCVLVPFGGEAAITGLLCALPGFTPRLTTARDFALRYRVLLLQSSNGTPVDISYGALPLEQKALERALPVDGLPVASLEDRILHILWRNRDGDLALLRSLTNEHRSALQWPYLDFWVPELAQAREDPEMLETYRSLYLG